MHVVVALLQWRGRGPLDRGPQRGCHAGDPAKAPQRGCHAAGPPTRQLRWGPRAGDPAKRPTRGALPGPARLATLLLVTLSLSWASVLISVPYLVSHVPGSPQVIRIAGAAHGLGAFICHQRPERSFHPWGVQVPVCARCEGIYLASPFAITFILEAQRRGRGARALASRSLWQRLLVLASIPTIVTVLWEWTSGDITPDVVRAIAGAVLGAAIAATVAAVAVGDLR